MKTLDRYLAGIFIRNFLLALAAMVSLFLFQALLGEMIDRVYPPNQIVYYNLLNIPQILVQMAPPAVLLATVMTLSGLARTNELVACFSIGLGLKRLVALFVTMVFMICCLMLIFQDRILPPTYRKRTTYKMREMEKKQDFFLDVKQDKIWYRSQNLIYNLQRFDQQTKTIFGMSVYTFDKGFNLVQVIDAEKAEFTSKGWRLMNGTTTTFSKGEPFPATTRFDEKALQIAETPTDFQEIEKEVKGLRLKELAQYIGRMKAAGADTKSYEVDFHSRISLSFIPFVMCFLGIPFSTRGRREGGMAKDLGFCLGITFFYWLFYSVGLSLGTNGALAPWLAAWLPSAIFGGLAAYLISRK
ncbi:MAG TPA: LPS export ABC transporter permease LptG [Bdellovibrionota bacterium]|nr:LPS export ABC transporter permease LptG [Bdellovibrionota bacterium]